MNNGIIKSLADNALSVLSFLMCFVILGAGSILHTNSLVAQQKLLDRIIVLEKKVETLQNPSTGSK